MPARAPWLRAGGGERLGEGDAGAWDSEILTLSSTTAALWFRGPHITEIQQNAQTSLDLEAAPAAVQ